MIHLFRLRGKHYNLVFIAPWTPNLFLKNGKYINGLLVKKNYVNLNFIIGIRIMALFYSQKLQVYLSLMALEKGN